MAAEHGERIAWHPGFASAVQLELGAYRGWLEYEVEHALNTEPLRIDLLVIKKNPGVVIKNDIASFFRGHNILEFKSEYDGLTIDDLYKTMAYGCLYKAYGKGVDAIDGDDVTLTLMRRSRPARLFAKLASMGRTLRQAGAGVYLVDGLLFPVQIVATGELDPTDHVWLASLASGLEPRQLKGLVAAADALSEKEDLLLADSVLDVVTLANSEAIERLKKGEDAMAKTLYEIMKPEIDEAIEQGKKQAIEQGLAEGRAEGLAAGRTEGLAAGRTEGRADAICTVVTRMLERGGFTQEDISDITGASLEEVQNIAASLQSSPP